MADDDFTADEIELFKSLSPDEKNKIERFSKWAGLKANLDPKNLTPSQNSGKGLSMTLADLKELMTDPPTRSILRHLLGEAETSEATKNQGEKPKQKKFGNLL